MRYAWTVLEQVFNVHSLVREMMGGQMIPTTSHNYVELFISSGFNVHCSVDFLYPHIRSSLPPCKRKPTLTFFQVRRQHWYHWRVLSNIPIPGSFVDNILGNFQNGIQKCWGHFFLHAGFFKEQGRRKLIHVLYTCVIKWIQLNQNTPHPFPMLARAYRILSGCYTLFLAC